MFKTALVLCCAFLVAIFAAQPVNADSDVTFTISGASGPSDSFTMSFALPSQPVTNNFVAGDDFYVYSPIPFSFSASNGGTASGLAYLAFYSLASIWQTGGLFVDFCADDPTCATGPEYQWLVQGPVLYSGPENSPTLTPGSFDFTGGQFLLYRSADSDTLDATGAFSGTIDVVATPEPGSAVLLIFGTLCLVAVGFQQKRLRPLA